MNRFKTAWRRIRHRSRRQNGPSKTMFERNQMTIGVVGTVGLALVLALAFNFRSLPVINSAETINIEFGDASGLHVGDPVAVAGVDVGEVKSIELAGDRVRVQVGLDTKDQPLGADSTAIIKVRTVLGQRSVELASKGTGQLDSGDTIPLARTISGYDISRSLEEITKKVSDTDTVDLSAALDALSSVQAGLPEDLHSSLQGLARLSETIGSRDAELRELFGASDTTSKVLADRNRQLGAMFGQGAKLFDSLNRRSDNLHNIIVQTRVVSDGLKKIAVRNKKAIAPALAQLESVLDLLNKNRDNLNDSISGLKTFTYQLGEVVGSGPFFSVLLQNILPANIRGQQPSSPGGPR